MSVPLTLLGLLEREPSHGYDLKRDYDTYFGRGKPLPYGQVYATLARLARDGKAVAGEAEPGIPAGDYHLGALGQETPRHGQAQAGRAAGDQRALPLQQAHGRPV